MAKHDGSLGVIKLIRNKMHIAHWHAHERCVTAGAVHPDMTHCSTVIGTTGEAMSAYATPNRGGYPPPGPHRWSGGAVPCLHNYAYRIDTKDVR